MESIERSPSRHGGLCLAANVSRAARTAVMLLVLLLMSSWAEQSRGDGPLTLSPAAFRAPPADKPPAEKSVADKPLADKPPAVETAPLASTPAGLPAEPAPADHAPAENLPADHAPAELPASPAPQISLPGLGGPEEWTSPEGISSSLQMMLLLAVVSLAPAALMMTTCFVRITVVLGLLRQALGASQLPPNQVMTSIALFMTLLVMSPVWTRVYQEAVVPYAEHQLSLEEAWHAGAAPIRQFMSAQIDRTGNRNDVWLFYKYLPKDTPPPSSYDDVPLTVLLPAFMLSELKTSFLIGFQIYLPFLVLDLVVASVTISMGMLMLPPVLVSMPLKLLLFVLVDGWHLVVGMLMESFQTFS